MIRLKRYKCVDGNYCLSEWKQDAVCVKCGKTSKDVDTLWDKVADVYKTIIPYELRPQNLWYLFKCWAWKRYTTIKPRFLGHTWCDRSTLMHHMVFEILCDFVEKEDWGRFVTQPELDELKEIYDWWINLDQDYPYSIKNFDSIDILEFSKMEMDHQRAIDEKCLRVIELRNFIWT